MRWLLLLALIGCRSNDPPPKPKHERPRVESYDPYREARIDMVEQHIAARGVVDPRVLEAMRHVPRHELVPEDVQREAYADRPLPITNGKTISQPYIVAAMTEAVKLRAGDKVLEIGTGSGYQAAVLAELGNDVYTIEIIEDLANRARADLVRIGYPDVHVRAGDGYAGWPEAAPFDAIIVTAAAPALVEALTGQLAPGGTLVAPVGGPSSQSLLKLRKDADGVITQQSLAPVVFVPLLSGMID